jgi:peptidoglycan/LPS O-acetylase OafA/YrhL
MRTDIQALRGLAVLLVVLYHMKIGPTDAGYLGVDVFFVISGYLITTLVAGGIDRGSFRLTEFYFRRAKRLLPAAYVTILVTALCAPWFLNQQEFKDFALQAIGAVTFTANMVLWQQTGYFEGVSDLKPLLHTWSLSLEEQYYMVLPAALLLLPRAFWLRAIIGALLVSLALCIVGGALKPIATFYLLPTRAWELLMGSAGALLVAAPGAASRIAGSRVVRAAFFPSLAILLILGAVPIGDRHPGAGALLICLATLFVILRHHEGLEQAAITKGLARVGDISYSLYLVHWPIISLLKNAWVGQESELSLSLRLAALVLSFAGAYLLYRYIEDPIRKAPIHYTPSLALKTGLVSVMLMAIAPAVLQASKGSVDFSEIRRINHGLGEACEYESLFEPKPECSSGDNPKLLVWGDSFAMHLVPGLLAQPQAGGVIQATRSACGPILNLGTQRLKNPKPGPNYDRAWAERCIEFNQSVLEFVRKSQSIETVVLSSPMNQYVSKDWIHILKASDGFSVVTPSIENSTEAVRRTAAELRAAGKKVVLITPPPSTDFNVGACLERLQAGRIKLGASENCAISVDSYRDNQSPVLALIQAAEKLEVPVIRLSDFLCKAETCDTMIDGTMLYRDGGHLSVDGSRLLATRMGWARLIEQQAR